MNKFIKMALAAIIILAVAITGITAADAMGKDNTSTEGSREITDGKVVKSQDAVNENTRTDNRKESGTSANLPTEGNMSAKEESDESDKASESKKDGGVRMSAKVESASEAAEESAETLAEESSHVHTEACEHEWMSVYKTVYHDAEYDVIHHDAVYETVHHDAEYQTVHHDAVTETTSKDVLRCNCGEYFDTYAEYEAHAFELAPSYFSTDKDSNGYWIGINSHGEQVFCNPETGVYPHQSFGGHTLYEEVVVQEAYDEEVLVKDAWDEQVVVTEAWDEYILKKDAWTEEVVDHYECSKCGEWE